jgi:hypothetical protein
MEQLVQRYVRQQHVLLRVWYLTPLLVYLQQTAGSDAVGWPSIKHGLLQHDCYIIAQSTSIAVI